MSSKSNHSYLWLIHPRHINPLHAIWALEGVGRINRDVADGVIQSHKSWFSIIELADLFKWLLLKPSRQRAHVQELFTFRRQIFLHLCSCHQNKKQTGEGLICSVDNHGETYSVPTVHLLPLKSRPAVWTLAACSVPLTILCKFLSFSLLQLSRPLPCLTSSASRVQPTSEISFQVMLGKNVYFC